MSWSWRIGRIAGIDVFVHFTFFLLLAWFAGAGYMRTGEIMPAVINVAFIITLFAIVVLHELGHALTARRYGIGTRDITLLPIGGVARLERMPEDPRQELVVALAGPMVNVVLAVLLYFVLEVGAGLSVGPIEEAMRISGGFLTQLFWINVVLVVFNLLPAFPMDGGRVLRALLAMRLDYVRATHIAASIGQAMAILFALAGLFGNPFLIFIGLFVWLGASQEASMVQMRSALGGIPVMRAMVANYQTLRPDDALRRAVEHMLDGFQQDFPVAEGDVLVGVLSHGDLAAALAQHGPEVRVENVMRRDFITVSPREMLEPAFAKLQEGGCHTVPVVENGRLVGLLTTENVTEILMIQEALRARQSHRGSLAGADAPRNLNSAPLPQSQRTPS
jgi:Zn-dependent protease/predicted transcriptional regulator